MKIAIIGGHFSPAHALINELQKESEVIVLGRKYTFEKDKAFSFEYRVCKAQNIPFFEISASRLQRNFSFYTLFSLPRVIKGFSSSRSILKRENVDVVVSFGGYLSIPVAFAAYSLGIPIILHEQTLHAGLANKWVSKIADKVCLSFESSISEFPREKCVVTGNLIREEVFKVIDKITIDTTCPLIYVTGGGGGSHFINKSVKEILPILLSRFSVIHQTGDTQEFNDFDTLVKIKEGLSEEMMKRYYVVKHILPTQIGWILKNCDLVIARSGINTVCEVLATQVPSLFIPIPHGQKNEQLSNAKMVKELGLGEYFLQKDASANAILEKINFMTEHKSDYKIRDKYALNKVFKRDSVKLVINEIQSIYEQNRRKKPSKDKN